MKFKNKKEKPLYLLPMLKEIEPTPGEWTLEDSSEFLNHIVSLEFGLSICTVWGKSPARHMPCKDQAHANALVLVGANESFRLLKKCRATMQPNKHEQKSMLLEEIDAHIKKTTYFKKTILTPISNDYYEPKSKG